MLEIWAWKKRCQVWFAPSDLISAMIESHSKISVARLDLEKDLRHKFIQVFKILHCEKALLTHQIDVIIEDLDVEPLHVR